MHGLIEQLTAAGPAVTDGAWGTQLQALGLATGACPDGWNLEQPRAGRGGRPGLRRGRQRRDPDQHLRGQPLPARPAWAGGEGRRDQPGRRGDLAPGRRLEGQGLRLDGPHRRHAHDGRGQPRAGAGGVRRAGPAHGRRRRRRDRHGDHVRPGRGPAGRRGRQGDRPAGGRLHGVRLGQGPRPHDDGHHARAGRRRAGRRRGRLHRLQLRPGDRGVRRPSAAACARPPTGPSGSRPTPACRKWSTARRSSPRRPRSSPPPCPRWSRPAPRFIGGCCGTTPEFIKAVCTKLGR